MPVRLEKAARTKAALMEQALALFSERGFDAVTVEDITRQAGVAKGSFYTYFRTKSDIIVEEFLRIDDYYREYASRNLRRPKTATAKLSAFTRAQMKYVRDRVGLRNLKLLYSNQILLTGEPKIIVHPGRHWFAIVRDVVVQGQASGEFRTDLDAGRLAELFNRSARSVFLDWCIHDGAFDLVTEGVSFAREWMLAALASGRSAEAPGGETGNLQ